MSLQDLVKDYLKKRPRDAHILQPPQHALAPFPSDSRPAERVASTVASTVKYVPIESLVLFIALTDIPGLGRSAHWAVFGTCLLLGPVYVFLATRRHPASPMPKAQSLPLFEMLASAVAFTAWAAAIPGSIFTEIRGYQPAFGMLAALTITPLLSAIEGLLDNRSGRAPRALDD